jgi:hypothetical protein
MRYLYRSSLLVMVLLLGILACAVPGVPLVDTNAQGTSIALTLNAIIAATQNASSADVSPTFSPSPSPSETFTLVPATLKPTETATATIVLSPTPSQPQISVSIPTNCRVGPGKAYEQVGSLMTNRTVQVYARDPSGAFWYIRNPDSPNEFCWVWGEYATVAGLTYMLPVYTPPPTPTATATPAPSFDSSYSGLVACAEWWPEIKIKNTGEVTFKSIGISVKDTVTSTSNYKSTNGFDDDPDCVNSTSRKTLVPFKAVTVSAPGFAYDPTGHKLRVTITLCSDTGQSGMCVSDTLTFTP